MRTGDGAWEGEQEGRDSVNSSAPAAWTIRRFCARADMTSNIALHLLRIATDRREFTSH
jgi:hypothetical protein